MYLPFVILLGFAFCYSLIVGSIERAAFSGPILFIGFGVLIGPLGLDVFGLDVSAEGLRMLADLTLALVLFCDAANANRRQVESSPGLPLRLLLIGLPLSIGLGALAGKAIFPALDWLDLAILATMLAATDAALGKAVVTNERVPVRIREGLNLESGLNDGICVPILLLLIALVEARQHESLELVALGLLLRELGIGVVVGCIVVALAFHLAVFSARHGWNNRVWDHMRVTLAAIFCFSLAQSLGGSGYIAAFVGGLTLNYLARKVTLDDLIDSEGIAEVLGAVTWVIFGAAVVGLIVKDLTWQVLAYAGLSLFVIRMLAVQVALLGSNESWKHRLFIGWFGPRGLASIVFAIIVANSDVSESRLLSVVVIATIVLSALLHGITANPLARRL